MKKNFLKKRKVIFLFLFLIFLFSLLNIFQKSVKNSFYFVFSPLGSFFWEKSNKILDFFDAIWRIEEIKKENQYLKNSLQKFYSTEVALRELKKENEFLKKALNLGLEKDFELKLAKIIGKNIGEEKVLINKGEEDGVRKDMVVITQNKVLVGKVDKVYKNFSSVTLISHKDNLLQVEIMGRDCFGVLKGKGGWKVEVDLVPKEKVIEKGDLVITKGEEGVYPSGLLIGKVKEVLKDDLKPFQRLKLESFFNLKELDEVFLILDF